MSFNHVAYKNLNPDLAKAGLNTPAQLYNHFIRFGIRENRRFNLILPNRTTTPTTVFKWELYRNSNPDLIKAGLKTKEDFERHFINHGIREGRKIGIMNVQNPKNQVNPLVSEGDIRNFFKGKRVAIIAPSPSVRETPNGDEIDKYDIIIRVNKNWQYSPDLNKYVGTRTDIVYNCINPDPECGGSINFDYVKSNLKYIAISIPILNNQQHRDSLFHNNNMVNKYRQFVANNNNRVKYYIVNTNLYNMYDNILKSRPNTGFMAILDILSYDIKELYIKGFTFFKDGYLSNYRNTVFGKKTDEKSSAVDVNNVMRQHGDHNIERQIYLFKHIYQKNRHRIKIDPAMKRILNII
jgi:hypothetical protein